MADYRDPTHIDPNKVHQITELVRFIREKIYGIDVREAIALALEKVYNDAAKEGNANMEVELARGIYNTLNDRLNASDKELVEKATKEDLNEKIRVLQTSKADKTHIWSMENMGQDIKEAMTGDSVAVVGKNAISTENIIDGQVTYYKTDFVEVASENLINKDTILNYKAIREGTGELVDNNYHSVFADIPVQPNTSYACRSVHDIARVSFYDAGGDFLSDKNNNTKTFNFETPDECYKLSIMIGGFSNDQAQLNLGSELKPYDDFALEIKYGIPSRGSGIMKHTFIDSEKILDTSIRNTEHTTELSSCTKVTYVAINSLDVPVRIAPLIERNYPIFYESGEFKSVSNNPIIIPPHGAQRIILNDALPRVLNQAITEIGFSYNALEIPTGGELTLEAWGLS